ncbi:unnamed protein product [Onchocerca flexuosa]|uniref:7TM_GPCR_Srx domain-containing protein n=1 Tax=Onchocerca flexuosa TaxID=387005 RepID=A0A183HS97_9BILA|nr:unnamed protein product [Onchocerca flexuosa]
MFDTTITTSTLIIAGCINFATLLKIKNYSKSREVKQLMINSSTKRKHDIFFFKQSCIGGVTMIVSALVFNIGQQVLTNKWALFAVTTISWEMAHVLDG